MTIRDLDNISICANASILRKFDYGKIKRVFYPNNEADIKAAIKYARKNNFTISMKGGGSGLSGACTGGNRERIFISTHRLKKIHSVNLKEGYAWVSPGLTPDEINKELKYHDQSFNVSPSSREMATVGGLISTDGGGNDAWMYGTMRDNTIAVEIFDEKGRKFVVTHKDATSDDPNLNHQLQSTKIAINDVASSHGTLGMISKLKIKIYKQKEFNKIKYGLIEFSNLNELGKAVISLIKKEVILPYSEVISYVMPEMSYKAKSPILIFKYPESEQNKIDTLSGKHSKLNKSEFEKYYNIRRSYPKLNPPNGTQFALFEGYGLVEKHLLNLDSIQAQIDSILSKHNIVPFGKYGHAPSKWYGEDDTVRYGYIQHSREVPSHKITGKEVLDVIIDIVELCKELDITPKPEHKWWLQSTKRDKLITIRKNLESLQLFNPWILEAQPSDLSSFV